MIRRFALFLVFGCSANPLAAEAGRSGSEANTSAATDRVANLRASRTAGFLIDSFATSQSVVADPTMPGHAAMSSESDSNVLGGHRDLYVEVRQGVAEAKVRTNAFSLNSDLQIDMSAGVAGLVAVTWDGVAGTSGLTPDFGLAADFTFGGLYEGVTLQLAVDAAGEGEQLELLIHSTGGRRSSALVEFPVVPRVVPSAFRFVPFEDFVGDADFTDVSAFQIIIGADAPSLDARVSLLGLGDPNTTEFEPIPEPTALTSFAVGCLALCGVRRRQLA